MAYRIQTSDRSLTAALRRIAEEQLGAAIAETKRPVAEADEAIHNIRKHCKKLRGLYRLMRSGFADYAEENAAARDAARMSSSLRDAGVLLKTFDALLEGSDPAPYAPLRQALTGETGAALTPDEIGAALVRQRKAFKTIRKRSRDWKVAGDPGTVLRTGLSKTWHRAAADMEAARRGADAEAFHDWRKRIKDHWYHSRLLQGFWPGPIRAHRETVKTLSELLGDYQDLSVFLGHLDRAELPETAEDLRLRALARRDTLAYESRTLAAPLFAGGPDALPNDWSKHWKHWAKRH
ncbi:CHAD domain-containing protein [Salipiger sp. P9]|uniref:CHAD domain-containing protein n=1 Tax=Salipiger pentaromativorans TaxID=2943193 RepID=UPI00215789A3|nr:CHAD domain-containing protein [Salipiger pentaromativorans]MCR8547850.1 CHAD domain-containing protein [Salipiger pentaromativorans]